MEIKFEDFKNEIEKIYDRFSVKRYDKDQVVMIGLTLQNRRANDIDIFIDEDISAFRILLMMTVTACLTLKLDLMLIV